MLADFQRRIAAGLLSPPDTVVGEGGPRGFAIHARNARLSLRGTLEEIYTVTRRIVGPDYFSPLADRFVAHHPPKHGWLSAFGDGFAEFIEAAPIDAELPYLADVARLEWARVRAANASDAGGLDLAHLASLAPETLESLQLRLHAAATLVSSSHPVFAIWQAHRHADDATLPPLDLAQGAQNVLVSRPAPLEVGLASLNPGDAALLATVAGGASFTAACRAAVLVDPAYDLAEGLGRLVALRAFATLEEMPTDSAR